MFEKLILQEHSKENAEKIAQLVLKEQTRMQELMDIFIKGDYRIRQRASWPIQIIATKNFNLISPYIKDLIGLLGKKDLHPGVKRNILNILQEIEIPSKLHGKAADLCFNLLTDTNESIAVRVFAMTVIFNISHHIPELKKELSILIEDYLPYASPAFVSRGSKILKALQGKGKYKKRLLSE